MPKKCAWFFLPGLEDAAVRLWKEGRPASYIAAELPVPGLTRSAVMGRLHRLGLARQPGGVPHRSRTYVRKPKPPKLAIVRPAGPPKPVEPPRTDGAFIYNLAPRGCRYAIGERDGQHTFCNHTQQDGSSYCSYHAELCQPKRRLAA
jgi:GcrA cell cycle regulator